MVVIMRPATIDDWARLYTWRNDPATLAASRNATAVPLDEHMVWLRRFLADKAGGRLYVARDKETGAEVGTARIDRLGEGKKWTGRVECSLSVDARYRGRGYAEQIIASLATAFAKTDLGGKTLVATVKTDNFGSLRAFANNNFVPSKFDGVAGLVELERKL